MHLLESDPSPYSKVFLVKEKKGNPASRTASNMASFFFVSFLCSFSRLWCCLPFFFCSPLSSLAVCLCCVVPFVFFFCLLLHVLLRNHFLDVFSCVAVALQARFAQGFVVSPSVSLSGRSCFQLLGFSYFCFAFWIFLFFGRLFFFIFRLSQFSFSNFSNLLFLNFLDFLLLEFRHFHFFNFSTSELVDFLIFQVLDFPTFEFFYFSTSRLFDFWTLVMFHFSTP